MKYRLIFLAVASASLALSGAAAYAALPAASAAVSAPASHSAAAEFSWYKAAFPWDHSDLKPDPAMTYGVLPNGVRYVILPHQTPKGRVSLYLDVQAGSYFETPEQLGYAHYIEHMAFNGTKHFAPGSLIPFFQKNGMSFGGDTNASTDPVETIYTLDLSSGSSDQLQKGLSILRDYADDQLFIPNEVKEEMGIILSEKRARDSESQQAEDAFRNWFYRGSKFTDATIGKTETIKAANSDNLRPFYDTWYRSDRMVVIAVGDVNPEKTKAEIEAAFGSMKKATASDPGAVIPSLGNPTAAGVRAWVSTRKESTTRIMVYVMHPRRHEAPSRAASEQDVADGIASSIFERRLQQREEKSPGIWRGAGFSSDIRSSLTPEAVMVAVTSNDGWKKALTGLEEESASAIRYGFTKEELDLALKRYEEKLRAAVQNYNGYQSSDIAGAIAWTINSDQVVTSPEQDLEFFNSIKKDMTLERVNAAFRDAFKPENRTIQLSGGAKATTAEVVKVWQEAASQPAKPLAEQSTVKFPYLTLPAMPTGTSAAAWQPILSGKAFQTRVAAKDLNLQIEEATLPNGIRLYLQPLTMEKGTVQASLIFGSGTQTYEDIDAWKPKLAQSVLQQHGVGKLTQTQTADTLGTKGIAVAESYSPDHFSISGTAQKGDVKTLLEALWTQYQQPTVDAADLTRVKESLAQNRHLLYETTAGAASWMPLAWFTGDLERVRPLSPTNLDRYTLPAVREVIAASRTVSPIAIVISGDFDKKAAVDAVAQLFNAEKTGTESGVKRESPLSFPSGRENRVVIADTAPKAFLNEAWRLPNTDGADRKTVMTYRMAASVLSDKLREVIREKLGAAYSPWSFYYQSPQNDGFGFIWASVQTSPDQLALVRKTLGQVMGDLASKGITEDELEKLKKPMITALQTQRKLNVRWEALLRLEVTEKQPWIKWNEEDIPALQAVTADDVTSALRLAFKSQPAIHIITTEDKAE